MSISVHSNAWTGFLDDRAISLESLATFVHCLEGLHIAENSIILERRSLPGFKSCTSELRLIQLCRNSELGVVNGCVGNDKCIWNFTFQSTQGRSVVDYYLLDIGLLRKVFVLNDLSSFFDHKP